MGGHGGLNILPQKRWNVYNYDNREKVRKDEEAAAREEQLKREQTKKRDAEFRLERLRATRGLAPLKRADAEVEYGKEEEDVVHPVESEPKTDHINLFEGIRIFDPVEVPMKDKYFEKDESRRKKMKKDESSARVVAPEDEKYRLGYGVAGKGTKLPWYLERRNAEVSVESEDDGLWGDGRGESKKKWGKKSLQELREERLKREKKEKERERALMMEQSRRDGGFSRRR